MCNAANIETACFLFHTIVFNYVFCKSIPVTAVFFIFITEEYPLVSILVNMIIFKYIVGVFVADWDAILSIPVNCIISYKSVLYPPA